MISFNHVLTRRSTLDAVLYDLAVGDNKAPRSVSWVMFRISLDSWRWKTSVPYGARAWRYEMPPLSWLRMHGLYGLSFGDISNCKSFGSSYAVGCTLQRGTIVVCNGFFAFRSEQDICASRAPSGRPRCSSGRTWPGPTPRLTPYLDAQYDRLQRGDSCGSQRTRNQLRDGSSSYLRPDD